MDNGVKLFSSGTILCEERHLSDLDFNRRERWAKLGKLGDAPVVCRLDILRWSLSGASGCWASWF